MFNYIKWDLINEFKSKKYILGFVAIIYILGLINTEIGIVNFLFGLVIIASAALSYVYGTGKVINSYKNRTFLLESMIPLSPKKILFAKYILAIIYNVMCAGIFIIGMEVAFSQIDIDFISTMLEFMVGVSGDIKELIIEIFVYLIVSSIAFTSLTTLIYITIKSLIPKLAGASIIAWILGLFADSFVVDTVTRLLKDSYGVETILYMESLFLMIFVVLFYFATSWFIENKLEIYN